MMTAAIVLASWMDQLDEDTTLGGPDLEIEASEEVHSYQSVDALVPEREHSEGEVRRRYAQHGELGHADPVAFLLADPVSSTSRASVVVAGPEISASTMISSRSRAKELESLIIDDQRRPDQRLCADARKPDRVPRIFRDEVANGMEGSTTRRPVPDDSRRFDLGAAKLWAVDIDQADVLVGVPYADLHPRQWFGLLERELFGSVHASILSQCDGVSSFLTLPTLSGSTVLSRERLAHLGRGAPVAQADAEQAECGVDELER
jgi:hypothetical protein